ncbi:MULTISPECIES: putative bifunctional diguanylate cyclase/phosphodiesterase [unclassified Xanthobacter]|uniref:putative bifunctional diguanylate cyclase/phosphodiesterase n=1 Tax=unclassified Xanthobacter TaxID=2623496 RepID=UPI001EDDCE18|nr:MULTISPECIES: EAL domain-containing protein [unclassified Xanthobacter]
MFGLAALVVLLGAGALILLLAARGEDARTLAREKGALAQAFQVHERFMERALESVRPERDLDAVIRGDLQDVHGRLGARLTQDFDLEYAYVTDGAGNLLYASENGRLGDTDTFEALRPALLRLLARSQNERKGLVVGGGKSVLLLARTLKHTDPATGKPATFIVLAADVMDEPALDDVFRVNEVQNVGLKAAEVESHEKALLLPNLYDGGKVAVTWHGAQPGGGLLARAMPALASVAAALCAIFFALMVRARRLAGALTSSEALARDLANEDQLTGLANRRHFIAELEAILAPPAQVGPLAVMYVDLDGFKIINDTHGHAVGDELLRVVGRRLKSCLGLRGCAGRVGGDEFVLFARYESDEELKSLVASLYGVIEIPVAVENQDLRVTASIGAARAPADGESAAELMRLADIALYRAKAEGGGVFRQFEPHMEQAQIRRRQVEKELSEALDHGELTVLYQPQVDVESERIVGFEALVRWDHPIRGRILPSEFVPIAERSRLISRLDAFVLRTACADAKALPGVTLAVNLSPYNLRSGGIVDNVLATLRETGFDPARLELELTESAIIDLGPGAQDVLMQLREKGVRFALDDFGTGYASLVHVRRYPITKIKIDRSFIMNLGRQRDAASIVEYTVRLGRALGITLTAEGVETREQLRFLRAFGSHQAQGYLFAPPLPLAAAVALLERQRHGDGEQALHLGAPGLGGADR